MPDIHAVTIRPIHRTTPWEPCHAISSCARRHYYQAICGCSWTDARGRRMYVEREAAEHLRENGSDDA
jgi:hypothetical protein